MIKPLSDYITETTPFLRRVFITGKQIGGRRAGKIGMGPRIPVIADAEEQERAVTLAVQNEHTLVSCYIDSWIRAELYLHACNHGFKALEGCECAAIPQHEQLYPLRADASGKPIDPMLVESGYAVLNPLWKAAPKEFFFGVNQDVLKLDGHVSRALRGDHYAFKIELQLHIPQNAVCVELRHASERSFEEFSRPV